MSDKKIPMTESGRAAIEKEARHLKENERPHIIEEIARARALGDLSENAEYHAAKERQGQIESRIAQLDERLRYAQIIDPSSLSGKDIKFGATVSLIDEDTEKKHKYQIVGKFETDAQNGKISIESPLARALIGKQKGDVVHVSIPSGERAYEILKVQYKKIS